MTMTDNLSYAWRSKPLSEIMPTSRLLDNLERAGYTTAGDVLDVSAETLAADVDGVGPRRALAIRHVVFAHAQLLVSLTDASDQYDTGEPQRVLVHHTSAKREAEEPQWMLVNHASAKREAEEPTPRAADAFVTIALLLGIGLVVYMAARWALS